MSSKRRPQLLHQRDRLVASKRNVRVTERAVAFKRRLDIQGLRALAILAIVAYHAGLHIPGGFTGVDVFFVISGFVIAGTLVAELSSAGRMNLRSFYARRVTRLLPAPAAMLVFVALVGILLNPVGARYMAAKTGVFASIFGANFYLDRLPTGYFDVSTKLNPLLHTWMLSVIVQLYIVFPILLALCWRLGRSRLGRGRSRELSWALIALAAILSFLLSYGLSSGSFPPGLHRSHEKLAFYSSPTRAWEFGAGALLVLAAPLLGHLRRWSTWILGVVGAAMLVASAFSIHEVSFRETKALLPVAGAVLVIAAGTGSQVGISRLLSLRPFVWLGDISFSLYLWHWPLIVFARALAPNHQMRAGVVALVVSFLPAWLSYRYIENPIRSGNRPGARLRTTGRTATALASACILIPLGANLGSLEMQYVIGTSSSMKILERSSRLHADVLSGCENLTPLGERAHGKCIWTVSRSRGQIVLFGDSQAGQFTEPVIRAGNRAGYNVSVVTASSCPYLGLRLKGVGGEVIGCPNFGLATLKTLISRKPSLVILATLSTSYLQNPSDGLGVVGSHTLVYDTQAKVRLWKNTLESMLQRLNRAGIPVVLVHPILFTLSQYLRSTLVAAQSYAYSRTGARERFRETLWTAG